MIKINHSLPTNYTSLLVGICIAGLFILSSCSSTRHYSYLKTIQTDTSISNFVSNDLESRIKPGDRLSITVSSLSDAEDAQFNKAAAPAVAEAEGGFQVEPDGTVQMHRLGRVNVVNKTRRQLAATLEKDLLPYMKEPIVNVQYLNHKVTVIGAVTKPGIINMPEEQLNIFEVLVKSGDIRTEGMKDKVMIIREVDKDKKVKLVNLEDHAIFTSPWYYLQPDDIVLVNEDYKQKDKAQRNQELRTNLSLIASGISLILIVADRVFR
jgi:polysaccharide export outer membrane protein